MAKVYSGRDGELRLGNNKLAKVVSFSVQSNLETLETTTLGENIRTYTPGIVGYSGSATLLYHKADDNSFNTTKVLNKLYKTGSGGVISDDTVKLTFRWIDGDDKNDIVLNAYITSASIGAATADIVRAEISFQATGELETVSIS
tara:strand:+ start:127 stop:561 length:435 start_codon:yes stop_codon:yes gene_type:complete